MLRDKLFILVLSFILFSSYDLLADSEKPNAYVPYPIVFVHGINSGPGIWDTSRGELSNYFANKYGFSSDKNEFFPTADYKGRTSLGMEANRGRVAKEIDNAITKLKKRSDVSVPPEYQKVIVVAHSMGGLVSKSLFAGSPIYKDKVYKIKVK